MPDIKLTALQQNVLKFFGENSFGQNFYWTGGTLLSYRYFQHRLSVDLDFFSDDLYFDDEYLIFINRLKQTVKTDRISFILQQNRRLYTILRGDENLKLELVFFPFKAIEPRIIEDNFLIKTDSLTDIMTNKTLSVYQRNEVKDVFDLYIYFTRQPKHSLFQLTDLTEKKFGVAIEPALLIAKINELINQFDSLKPLLIAPEENLSQKIKSFFQEIFNQYAKERIK